MGAETEKEKGAGSLEKYSRPLQRLALHATAAPSAGSAGSEVEAADVSEERPKVQSWATKSAAHQRSAMSKRLRPLLALPDVSTQH